MGSEDHEEKALIAQYLAGLKESLDFFSPQRKLERELWVGRELLHYLALSEFENELLPSDDDPPDLFFKGAKFELKEIVNEGRQRGREYKEALIAAAQVTTYAELLEEYTPMAMSACEAVSLTCEKAKVWSKKYAPAVTRSLDLLFYLNWQDYSITGSSIEYGEEFELGSLSPWRSVSVVSNDCAFVLFVNTDAPEFLQQAVGVLHRKQT